LKLLTVDSSRRVDTSASVA